MLLDASSQVCVPSTQWGQTNPKCQSLEQRKFNCRAVQEEYVAHAHNAPDSPGLGGKAFIGKTWGEGSWLWDFLLIGWWWGNRVMLW